MEVRDERKLDDAILEIATLLAAAYRRRASIRLVHRTPDSFPSTEELANARDLSVHELRLTSQRIWTSQQ
jgi:hypothetical protein